MTIREFIRTVWAGKYYVLAAVVVVVVAALVILSGRQNTYHSAAVVQLQVINVSSDSEGGDTGGGSSEQANTDTKIVTSDPVVKAVAAAIRSDLPPAVLAERVVDVGYDPDKNLTTITASAHSPEEAVALANAFASAYVKYLPTVVKQQVSKLDAQIEQFRAQYNDANADLRRSPGDPVASGDRAAALRQLQGLSTSRSALAALVEPANVITPAEEATPQGMSRATIVVIAALAGLLVGIGLAFARRGLDFSVRSSGEAASMAQSPVLAELYGVGNSDKEYRKSGTLPISRRGASPFTESIRELRTAVQVSIGDVGHAVVVVTAADQYAPRAFITANLAASFALSGRRTIAVAGDLRRPLLESLLPAPEGWTGEAGPLRPTRVPNLLVMPVQNDAMDPADYLATDRVRSLLKDLSEQAAVIVIDAPPVLAAADATILGGYANGVVLVASAGHTDRTVLTGAADRLRINNVPLVGIALTGLRSDRRMVYASTYGSAEAIAEETAQSATTRKVTQKSMNFGGPITGAIQKVRPAATTPPRRSGDTAGNGSLERQPMDQGQPPLAAQGSIRFPQMRVAAGVEDTRQAPPPRQTPATPAQAAHPAPGRESVNGKAGRAAAEPDDSAAPSTRQTPLPTFADHRSSPQPHAIPVGVVRITGPDGRPMTGDERELPSAGQVGAQGGGPVHPPAPTDGTAAQPRPAQAKKDTDGQSDPPGAGPSQEQQTATPPNGSRAPLTPEWQKVGSQRSQPDDNAVSKSGGR